MANNVYEGSITLAAVEDGESGATTYTWIIYADDNHGTNMSPIIGTRTWMGIASNKSTPSPSTPYIYTDYQWSKVVGKDGEDGAPGLPGAPGEDGKDGENAPPTIAQYSVNGISNWHSTFDSTNDAWIRFSYDNGATWGAAIKIRGEDGKDAGLYHLNTNNVEKIYRFVKNDSIQGEIIEWSPENFSFVLYEQDTKLELEDYEYKIDLLFTTEQAITNLQDDTDLDSYIIEDTTEEQVTIKVKDLSSSTILGDALRTQDACLVIHIYINGQQVLQNSFMCEFGTSYEMARFNLNAASINASIDSAALVFDREGLTIQNGNFRILNSDSDPILSYNSITKQLDVVGGGTFSGELQAASGTFTGTLSGADGSFSGEISASSGTIGGFTIRSGQLISTDGNNAIELNGATGEIKADTIQLGTGATIQNYINLGNTARLYGNSSESNLLIAGTGPDEISPETASLIIKKDGTISVGTGINKILIDGNSSQIAGSNWTIGNDWANFDNVNVAGKIISSIFEYSKIQTAAGTMLFRPVFEIGQITRTATKTCTITLNSGELIVGDVIKLFENNTELSSYSDDYGVSGRVTANNNGTYTVTLSSDINLTTKNFKYLLHLGNYSNDDEISNAVLMGINATAIPNIILEKGLTIKEPIGYSDDTCSFIYGEEPKLYLGDLSVLSSYVGELSDNNKYGLYSDNVYLNGSLTTKTSEGLTNWYSGINTNGPVYRNAGDLGSRIIFWAGADSTDADSIVRAPFQVTKDGSIFANKGIFEGTLITRSDIYGSSFHGAKIYGWSGGQEGTTAPLEIYSTDTNNGGIIFRRYSDDGVTLKIDANGFYTSKQDSSLSQFISINNGEATFNGRIAASSLDIGNFSIIGNEIINKDGFKLQISQNSIKYYTTTGSSDNTYFEVGHGVAAFNVDSTNVEKNFTLGNKMNYKQVFDNNNVLIGYDLFIN